MDRRERAGHEHPRGHDPGRRADHSIPGRGWIAGGAGRGEIGREQGASSLHWRQMQRVLARVQGFAESLGGPGLFILAFLDSSFLSFPQVVDILVVLLTVQHKERVLVYALMAMLGSMGGCYALYRVGRRGGEALLARRFNQRQIDRAVGLFRRYGLLAVIVPSLMPPPTPFKIFVLAAGVARMRTFDFLLAVAIGRFVRYFGQGLLAVWYGDRAILFIRTHAEAVGLWLGVAILVGGVAWFWWRRRRGAAA
jgi:membrane protein YqaA with SNARE-associated domain